MKPELIDLFAEWLWNNQHLMVTRDELQELIDEFKSINSEHQSEATNVMENEQTKENCMYARHNVDLMFLGKCSQCGSTEDAI